MSQTFAAPSLPNPVDVAREAIAPSLAAPYCPAIVAGLFFIADLIAILASGFLVPKFIPAPDARGATALCYYFCTFLGAVTVVGTFAFFKLYDFSAIRNPRSQLKPIAATCVLTLVVLAAIVAPLRLGNSVHMAEWLYAFVTLSIAGVYGERWAGHELLRRLARAGRISRNVVVVGAGEQGARLIRAIRAGGESVTRVTGIFDDRADRVPRRVEGCDILGTSRDLVLHARNHRVDDIFIALPWTAESRIQQILAALRPIPARIHLCPERGSGDSIGRTFVEIEGVAALNVAEKPLEGWSQVAKAIEDRVLATAILIFLLPLLAFIAIAIKLDSPGPVLFRQKRHGWNNKVFMVWKFRTMYHDQRDENAVKLTSRDDPRVTRLGRFLRRASLDELPQFINVLTGEMSIVGPRPHPLQAKAGGKLYNEVVADYAVRHKIKPGVTGWAQVNGWRGDTDTEEKLMKRVEFDLHYMENWSVLFDLYIILRTVFCVLSCDAY